MRHRKVTLFVIVSVYADLVAHAVVEVVAHGARVVGPLRLRGGEGAVAKVERLRGLQFGRVTGRPEKGLCYLCSKVYISTG